MAITMCAVSTAEPGVSVPQGPTHKKALAKAEAERRRNEALGNMRWAAENASVRP